MLTDRPPRRPALQEEFLASDRLGTLELPPDDRLCAAARAIEVVVFPDAFGPTIITPRPSIPIEAA